MRSQKSELNCLNCNQPEDKTPLLQLHYKGKEQWICSQCLPTLIHAPQKLVGKMDDAEQIKAAAHHKH